MANLYKCDICSEIEEGNTRLQVGIIPVGKNFKDRRNFDLCPGCGSRAEVKGFLRFLGMVESLKEAAGQ